MYGFRSLYYIFSSLIVRVQYNNKSLTEWYSCVQIPDSGFVLLFFVLRLKISL